MRIHLDTDFAGDPDDACSLAMVLGWPDTEVVGITTTADPDGRRAGYVKEFLQMLGIRDVPVAPGTGQSTTTGESMGGIPDHDRFWGDARRPVPHATDVRCALELLRKSIDSGAVVAAIGPYSNLALLESSRPGALSAAPVVTMGGWVFPFGDQYPDWGPERDWNVASDPDAALTLFESQAELTFVPCPAAVSASLRASELARVSASGPVGALLAEQSMAHGADGKYVELARDNAGLPDDLVNFHWDPVTCATALGWSGARVEEMELRPVVAEQGALRFEPQRGGRRTSVVTAVQGAAFSDVWLTCVENAQSQLR